MKFGHCPERNHWSFEWFSESSFMVKFPSHQEVLDVSPIAVAFHRTPHHFSSSPDCSNKAEVPYLTLRTALSVLPVVSERWGVDIKRSRITLCMLCQIPRNCQCQWLLALCFSHGAKNFRELFSFSFNFSIHKGYAWKHWSAKSCTTAAYRWLWREFIVVCRDFRSPNVSARGMALPVCFLQRALVILVACIFSKLRSLGRRV